MSLRSGQVTEGVWPGASWQVVDVRDWTSGDANEVDEPLGTKEKFWVSDPGGRPWLFKFARVVDDGVRGEDWAEWVVHRLAAMLGVPTAVVRPAVCGDRRGVVSRSVVSNGERLEHGNELLARRDLEYDADAKRHNPRYTVQAVQHALRDVGPPDGYPDLADSTGFDVWTGYLILDAWVAGRDRHHENWAAVTGSDGGRRLAPSFDHGNALGFQEREDRIEVLATDTERLLTWSRRGRSHHFASKPSLVVLASDAMSLASPRATEMWRHRLGSVSVSSVEEMLREVPPQIMSEARRTFCLRLLEVNRRRVLDRD